MSEIFSNIYLMFGPVVRLNTNIGGNPMKKEKLYLEDVFDVDWDKVKIKFNQINPEGKNPLEIWKQNPEEINNNWLFWENDKNRFQVGDIAICLIKMSHDRWLLTTVKEITKVLPIKNGVHYEGQELKEYHPYFGRLIIQFHKSFMSVIRKANTLRNQLEVLELLPENYNGDKFPGYDKVHLSWYQLQHILDCKKVDWIQALAHQKGIYLITDTKTGNLYVGSASGNQEGLLQRWEQYIKNGHGGNQELKQLSFDYIQRHFHYTILENYNFNTDEKLIKDREDWWKTVLDTRKHGYNKN